MLIAIPNSIYAVGTTSNFTVGDFASMFKYFYPELTTEVVNRFGQNLKDAFDAEELGGDGEINRENTYFIRLDNEILGFSFNIDPRSGILLGNNGSYYKFGAVSAVGAYYTYTNPENLYRRFSIDMNTGLITMGSSNSSTMREIPLSDVSMEYGIITFRDACMFNEYVELGNIWYSETVNSRTGYWTVNTDEQYTISEKNLLNSVEGELTDPPPDYAEITVEELKNINQNITNSTTNINQNINNSTTQITNELGSIYDNITFQGEILAEKIATSGDIQEVLGIVIGDATYSGDIWVETEEDDGLIAKLLKGIWGVFNKIWQALFEVDNEKVTTLINNFNTVLEANSNLLGLPLYLITSTMNTFIGYEPQDFILSWNAINYQGIEVIPSGQINFNEFINNNAKFKEIYDIMILIESIGFIFLFASWMRNMFLDLLGINWLGLASEEPEDVDITIENNVINTKTGETSRTKMFQHKEGKTGNITRTIFK